MLDEKGNYVGFDVVIGNPPYIRQEDLGESKSLLKKTFPQTYAGTADLYVFFVEQGFKVMRPEGNFIFIMPNKWMRAGYGLGLRKFSKRTESFRLQTLAICRFLMMLPLILVSFMFKSSVHFLYSTQ